MGLMAFLLCEPATYLSEIQRNIDMATRTRGTAVTPRTRIDQCERKNVTPIATIDRCEAISVPPNEYGNEETCISSLLILPDDRLIVAGFRHKMLHLFNAPNVFVAHTHLSNNPHDTTAVGENEIVVTDLDYLQFVHITEYSLNPGKAIKTGINLYGVAYCQNHLFVMDRQYKAIKVLDMSGKVLKTIPVTVTSAWYLATSPVDDVIYLADYGGGSVTCMTMEGTVLSMYSQPRPFGPLQLTVHPNGTLFINDYRGNSVHHITSQCTHIETLLNNGEIEKPRAICFNSKGDKLYMSEDGSNQTKVLVYSIKDFPII